MRVWTHLLIAAGLLCAGSLGARAWGCHVEGETCRLDQPGQPWVAMTPSGEYSTCDECNAAIQEAYDKYPRYYRDLHCVGCDCDQNDNNGGSNAGPSNNPPVQGPGDENGNRANLAKQQKFNEDKQDALSQLKGVSGDSEDATDENGGGPVSQKTQGRREKARHHAGGGFDQAPGMAPPAAVNIPPAPSPVPDTTLQGLKKEVKRYKAELEKKKKKIQELNVKITQLAVHQSDTAPTEPVNDQPTPAPGAPKPEPAPARPTPTASKAATSLDELNDLRQKELADESDLENKISDSEKKIDEMSKPTPAP